MKLKLGDNYVIEGPLSRSMEWPRARGPDR